MSQQARTNNLFGVVDWKNIYESFRDADFKSYDFETLRKSMVDYLRTYHPENFNDYINSSEFIALVDIIAFMGQSLSFRFDMDVRESFIETAQRAESIIKLAKMNNYEIKRCQPARGYLKITSITTNEDVADSLNFNLNSIPINWNDPANVNWVDQWNSILNAAFISSQSIGVPGNTNLIDGIKTSEYAIDLYSGTSPYFGFSSTVNGTALNFEAVNPTSKNSTVIFEQAPLQTSIFNLLYKDDGRGLASNNTGFFLYFKQGSLQQENFTITESLPNRVVKIGATNVNNTDVWLYEVDKTGAVIPWTQVDAVHGNSVIYNNLPASVKKVYSINTGIQDTISIQFGDGVFGDIPVGQFMCFVRTSSGTSYRINPSEMSGIQITVPYTSKTGRKQVLTIVATLKYTVGNAAQREDLSLVKIKAPQNYYTQNRMVNGQDYNSLPYVKYNNILKIKAVNRTSSGVSRYLDVVDPTGRYSSTNIFCADGYLYREPTVKQTNFTVLNRADAVNVLENKILPMVADPDLLAYFYNEDNAASFPVTQIQVNNPPHVNITWKLVSVENATCNGYMQQTNLISTDNSEFANQYQEGAILRFVPPTGMFFDVNNNLVTSASLQPNWKTELYATVKNITIVGLGDAYLGNTGKNTDGTGAIVLSGKVPTGAILERILPIYVPVLPNNIIDRVLTLLVQNQTIQLRYNSTTRNWSLNTDTTDPIMMTVSFVSTVGTLSATTTKYVFGSERETRFFYDPHTKIYDPASGKQLIDNIAFLKINSVPTLSLSQTQYATDINMSVVGQLVKSDGYIDDTRVYVGFTDFDSDSIPDRPYFYQEITNLSLSPVENQYVFFQAVTSGNYTIDQVLPKGQVKIVTNVSDIDANIYNYVNNDIVFVTSNHSFFTISRSGMTVTKVADSNHIFSYRLGRQNIAFNYRHNAPSDHRIDPSPSNIIDIFVLDKTYADSYIQWLRDTTGKLSKPSEPTTESLKTDFANLENYRMLSDAIVFNPVKFKLLFGSKADVSLQSKFLVVKNTNSTVSDSEIKSQLITNVNNFFDINNWEFGETFYFSELAAYLHSKMSSIINSVHLVPNAANQVYGDLQQVLALPYELFTSCATVNDVQVVTSLTNTNLRMGAI